MIARSISELKYLVGFAIATVAVANHTREAADEAHCRMEAANVTAAPSVSTVKQVLKVGLKELLSGADVGVSPNVSLNSSYCLAEKEARLTYGWDLNDWEADLPILALISLVIATHFVAFVWILRQATKYTEGKHVAGCHSNRGTTLNYARPYICRFADALPKLRVCSRWVGLRATLPSASRSTWSTTSRLSCVRGRLPST